MKIFLVFCFIVVLINTSKACIPGDATDCIERLSFDCFDKNGDGFIEEGPWAMEITPEYFPAPPVISRNDKDNNDRLDRAEYIMLQRDPEYIEHINQFTCPGLDAEFCK